MSTKDKWAMIMGQYQRWLELATCDQDVAEELKKIEDNHDAIEDAFYRSLEFGTGGLRGVIGAGPNRMNVHTVAQATQGLANYVLGHFAPADRAVAISYDSRIKSNLFADVASAVFLANGIKVYRYTELMPTPCLSYAVRALGCCAGVMVTASHNPAKYNGYKVYEKNGCQITSQMAVDILAEIQKTDPFDDVKSIALDEVKNAVEWIDEKVTASFIECVKAQSVLFGDEADKDMSIVYTPLNGTGLVPVTRTLIECGYQNVVLVEEQRYPDGHFPTCPFPNPELKEAMALGVQYAQKHGADLLVATDPDCDRVGIAVKNGEDYTLLSGDETGLLLLDYICAQRTKHGRMPAHPTFVKTIVTMDLAEKIASHYGVKTINVLTGFKYIGEQIGLLEAQGRTEDYILGYEESYGYLSGTHVRDKDAVNGVSMIVEMFGYYRKRGISLVDKLNELYAQYGYCYKTLHSYQFEGSSGMDKMKAVMKRFRQGTAVPMGTLRMVDYLGGVDGLPKADVIKQYTDYGSMVIRPSGTEPKLKVYISVVAESKQAAVKLEQEIVRDVEQYLQ